MDALDVASIRGWFRSYALSFADGDGRLPPMQQMKLDHCLRVARDARIIAERLGWGKAAVSQAEVAGLLHDVGRFSQFAEFGTFQDRRSIDHAQRSWDVIESNDLQLGEDGCRKRIETAVRLHNRREVPDGMSGTSLRLLLLVRDADRLDIAHVFDDAIRNGKLGLYPEIAFRVDLDGPPSPAVLAHVGRGESVPYEAIRSLIDFALVQLNWIGDMCYVPTLELVQERQVVDRLADSLPGTAEVQVLLQRTRGRVLARCGAGA